MRPQTAVPGEIKSNQSGRVQSGRAPSASHRSVQNILNSNRDAAASMRSKGSRVLMSGRSRASLSGAQKLDAFIQN
tara:strand:- start:70 stop:297 length:228 start_codon:yes stop_codon:yes gene_type:complete